MSKKPIIQVESSLDESRQAWIYKAEGKLIGSQLCYEFLEEARDRVKEGVPNVVIDLADVTMLNSTGIGIIASLFNSTKENGGKIYLVGATEKSRRPLSATHLWGLLEICDSMADLPEKL